ncbi:MAG: NAD-dependent epimerase/dehydratase family protein [Bdellovibrionales bacterium]|nr:NAD-dependent epimerase/dehydratase family protein [Bdellovibrionales bacterium]
MAIKSLVTGGAGFIGSNLALTLEKLGHEVVVVDNFQFADQTNLKEFKGKVISLDVSTPYSFSSSFDIIFHQAAITDPRYPNDEETFNKNIEGFKQMISLADRCEAKLVYASTAGLYGNGLVPMKEQQEKQILTIYGRSKLKMDEMAVSLFSKRHIVGLRYFNVFGPREAHKGRPASMIYHLYQQMKDGKRPRIFNWGEQIRDFIYVKDIVTANLKAVDAPSGVYNVATGVGTSFNQLVKTLNEVMNTKLDPEYFEMPYDAKTYQANTQGDPTLAEQKMGFKSEWKLKEAIEDYLQWLQKK